MSLVYLIQIGETGPVKIGLTEHDDVAQRLQSLQHASPWELHVRRVIPVDDALALEQEIHRRFLHLRMRGEWFAVDDLLTAFMESDDVLPASSLHRGAGPMPHNVVSLHAGRCGFRA